MTAPTLTTKLDRESPEAKARFAHNHALAQQLRAAVGEAALGKAGYFADWWVARSKHDARPLDIGADTLQFRRMLIGHELMGAG
ncbi:hypothetical protein [Porphyrobacter sp. ULC335]|uniref:hypothetical protein n=1 Tax=Porphyrobacter sp. ULC335 TaxID=2854260 RepID=UPI0024C9E889|nr:hypothetical protein [Porphyrobacter sp. ULC335]UYV16470.1 hypothetical protein KVF90_03840 [Porphyrobacter sp. ULC335]